jgi:hypothetical protein
MCITMMYRNDDNDNRFNRLNLNLEPWLVVTYDWPSIVTTNHPG